MTAFQIKPDVGDWRFEYKYRLSPQQYHQVKAAIRPYVRPDEFTSSSDKKRYIVRSLYFDTSDMRAFQEKVDGNCDRTKLRIRTYAGTFNEGSDIRVEMKARKGISVEKKNTFIPVDFYKNFIQCSHWPKNDDPVLVEFERYVHLKNLKPQVLVEYYREGFSAAAQKGLRFTFDQKVRSTRAASLFPIRSVFHYHSRGVIVFEIKCNKSQPDWLYHLVKDHGLRIVANSKFAQAIEVSRPEIVQPAWSY